MDENVKQLLTQNLMVAQENNLMLKKLVSAQKWAAVYRVVYWAVIIFSSIGAMVFLKPYLGNIISVYTGGGLPTDTPVNIDSTIKSLNTNKTQVEDLLNTMK